MRPSYALEVEPAAGRPVVTAYLFDRRRGRQVESWEQSLRSLGANELLWLDLVDAPEDEQRAACGALGVDETVSVEAGDGAATPGFVQHDGYLHVTAVAVSDEDQDPARETVAIECFVGVNWIMTRHTAEIAALEDFRGVATGEGEIGTLDAPSFLADLLEWIVTSYMRAFDEIEEELEEFDINALSTPSNDPGPQIKTLIDIRRRVGHLRRALAPHREIVAALGHSEFDPISTEGSSERFTELAARVDATLASARDAKDGVASSFDVLIVRTEHRTNEIVKVLTLASILLLPGALLAGVAGMNVNFNADTFVDSGIFWVVSIAIVGIAVSTLVLARLRRWI